MPQTAPPSCLGATAAAELGRRTVDFRHLLDRLPAGAYLCDPEGLITYYNQRALELWGRAPALNDPADRFCGSLRLFTVDGRPLRHDECWMALALGRRTEYNGREIVIERPDGHRVTALAHANPIRDEQGQCLGAVNVLFDITGWRESEARQRELETALTHMARLSLAGEMAAGFAHELNQPLTSIANYGEACIELLRCGGTDTGELVTAMTRVVEQAEHAGEIIRRLRGFTRRASPQQTLVEPLALLRSTLEFVAIDARAREVRLHAELPDALPPVWADAVQIQQVLVNLLRNGIEATSELPDGERRKVAIAAWADAALVTVDVSDTGTGLAPEVRERLFYPFATTRPEGMGLGLSISHRIVEAHGGRLWLVEDGAGPSGARFRFTLPIARTGQER